jgi:hypothetical protein
MTPDLDAVRATAMTEDKAARRYSRLRARRNAKNATLKDVLAIAIVVNGCPILAFALNTLHVRDITSGV